MFEENGSLYENKAFGNLLISIGTLIDAIAIITPEEKEKQRRILLATGGWIEFTGSVIEAYAVIQNINEKKLLKINTIIEKVINSGGTMENKNIDRWKDAKFTSL